MAISANYPAPVYVNGFPCKNCTDVDYAKKNIDPAHPKSGPFGIDAKVDPSVNPAAAVTLAGATSGLAKGPGAEVSASGSGQFPTRSRSSAPGVGARLDIAV
jgi:hypothetical protein